MVSVVFAIWPFPQTPERRRPAGSRPRRRPMPVRRTFYCSKPRASFAGGSPRSGFDIAWHHGTGADVNDVNDVPSLSEPHGPDGAMADRGRGGAEISQPRAAGRVRQAVRAARRGARTDLALLADLCAAGLRHRQGAGRQSGTGGDRGSHLRHAVRLAAAFQEGELAGAAAAAAGGADVRPFRDAVARHREDAAAGPRRLHHRLAQSARHSARPRPLRPRGLHRSPDHLPRQDRPARAHGGDLPALGVGAGGRRHHVGGQSSRPPGDADPDGRPDRHADPADQGQRIRQEQADRMVRRTI